MPVVIVNRLRALVLALLAGLAAYVSFSLGGALGGVAVLGSALLAGAAGVRMQRDARQQRALGRLAGPAYLALAAVLVVYLGFNAGGFFPPQPTLLGFLGAVAIAVHVTLTNRPADALMSRSLLLAAGALGLYAAWVLLSAVWSDAPGRALTEFGLALLYWVGLVLSGLWGDGEQRLRWLIRGLALGISIVCLAGLASRTVPSVWPSPSSLDLSRLSYPVTYINALGLLAVLGLILCLGLTCDREPRALRALGAMAAPGLATTLLLTFSRGAIAAGIVGIVVYVLVGRSRLLVTGLIAVLPTTAIAVRAAYRADLLAAPIQGNHAAIAQGHHVALVVAVCSAIALVTRIALLPADSWLIAVAPRRASVPRRFAWPALAAVAVVGALALGIPHQVTHQYHRFVQGNVPQPYRQLRDRLTDPGADLRIDLWKPALSQFAREPLHGGGAGTYEWEWAKHRPITFHVLDAHSLYLETLGELGLIGSTLLIVGLAIGLVGVARCARGSVRPLYAVVLAAYVVWLLRAGLEWDWEMPVVTLPVFLLVGASLVPVKDPSRLPAPGRRRWRAPVAVTVLAAAGVAAVSSVSQSHTDAALAALSQSDCAQVKSSAAAARSPLAVHPQAREARALCVAASGDDLAAKREIDTAVGEDPGNWELRYGQALITAAAGLDANSVAKQAHALNPRESVITDLLSRLRSPDPASRASAARVFHPRILNNDYPSIFQLSSSPAAGR